MHEPCNPNPPSYPDRCLQLNLRPLLATEHHTVTTPAVNHAFPQTSCPLIKPVAQTAAAQLAAHAAEITLLNAAGSVAHCGGHRGMLHVLLVAWWPCSWVAQTLRTACRGQHSPPFLSMARAGSILCWLQPAGLPMHCDKDPDI